MSDELVRCGCGGVITVDAIEHYGHIYPPDTRDHWHGFIACDQCGFGCHVKNAQPTREAAIAAAWEAYYRALGWRRPNEVPEVGREVEVCRLLRTKPPSWKSSIWEWQEDDEFPARTECWRYVEPPSWAKEGKKDV